MPVRTLLRRAAFALVLSLACLLPLLFPRSAQAQPWTPREPTGVQPTPSEIEEASRRYKKGIQLYDVEGDVGSALVELERAYDIAPNFIVLFNIGQVARTARDYVTSQRAFEAYLRYGGASVPADKRNQVENELRTLRDLVATIKITTNATEGSVLVDDLEHGRLPLAGVQVNPGSHKVTIQSGTRASSKNITVVGGETQGLEIMLELGTGGPVGPATTTSEPSYAWVGWAVTGTLAAAAIVTGSVALVKKGELEDQSYFGAVPPDDLASDENQVTALAISTDVLIACAAVSAGISLYFTIRDLQAQDAPAKPATPTAALRLGPSSVWVVGTF